MKEFIEQSLIEKFEKNFDNNPSALVSMNAAVKNGLKAASENYRSSRNVRHTFNISLPQDAVTNQKKSGRCWMFAAMNILRFDIIKKLSLKSFEFSQNFTFFYDKLEKANYFLENILKTADMETSERIVAYLLEKPIEDGGQWDMICNIIKKYGAVPKYAMPESAASSSSSEMDACLSEKLRGFACSLRKSYREGKTPEELRQKKEAMLEEIYRILCICLGKPPKTFDFEIRNKNDKFISEKNLTPLSFLEKYTDAEIDDYISLINAPTADKPYHRSYGVKYLGNVSGGRPVRYLNLRSSDLKEAAVKQLKEGKPVWFGCDVGKWSNKNNGIMDLDSYDYKSLLQVDFPMNKGERLEYGQSLMTHAMVLQGVNLDENGKPERWRIENSWGKECGEEGYFVMTDRWFDEYTYQIVVDKKYLSEELIKEYESEPIMLEAWDPMGSLA